MNRSTLPRRGMSIVWLTIAITLFCAFVSLAVDHGRVQVAKTELQRAADAAARYAIGALGQGVAAVQDRALQSAGDNKADGTSVVLNVNQDVEFGNWNQSARTFSVLNGAARANANAIRVTARRTAARGNGVPLTFARLIGINSFDIAASAITARKSGYTLVGINSVSLSGVALIDSYDSTAGPYSSTSAGDKAIVVSNGNISVSGSCLIRGEAHAGAGAQITGSATITGSSAPLTEPLAFPMPTVDPNFNNASISSYISSNRDLGMSGNRTYNIPAGIYSLRNVSLGSSATLNIQGDVTLYISGDLNLSGGINVLSNRAGDFKIRMTRQGTRVDIGGNSALYADLYAPGSDVTIRGTGDFYGTVVGRTLSVSGRGGVHWDETVYPYGGAARGYSLVQ